MQPDAVCLLHDEQRPQDGARLRRLLGLLDLRPIGGFLRRADAARRRGAWAEAAEAYAAALRRRPRHGGAWKQLGHMLKEDGALDRATQAYRNALALRPRDADAMLHLGHLLSRRGAAEEAARLLARGMDIAPHLAPLRREAGRVVRDRLARLDAAMIASLEPGRGAAVRRDAPCGAQDVPELLRRSGGPGGVRAAGGPRPTTIRAG
jgi:tetratricopeptide (TPR) repeat protein